MPHYSDDVYLGPVPSRGRAFAYGGFPDKGYGPLGRTHNFDIVAAALSTTAICAAQAIAGAANATINGASATGGVATMDHSRALQYVSANAGDTTQTVTVTGTDRYGRTQTELVTLNGTTVVNGLKGFKTVTRVAVSAAMTGNLSVGNTDTFSLPVYVADAAYIIRAGYNNTLAANAGTFTKGDATSPATNATGDSYGTFKPASATDGAKRLVIVIALTALQVGPNATDAGLYGVTPV